MKKLPIGIQTFSKIIEGNCVYVDKTKIALDLIRNGDYYFLSRPRRFGKSLFVDTLKEIFEGNKRLFEGLYIEDKWDFEVTHPVVKLSFSGSKAYTTEELQYSINWQLKHLAEDVQVDFDTQRSNDESFATIIRTLHQKTGKKVVILIDEYDKPILDNLTDRPIALAARHELRELYSVIKQHDAFIRFVFITGVSKFAKMNLFSGLNSLQDITLNPTYGNICGYTHHDLTTTFAEHLSGVDMEEVRQWYNGYNYFADKVYNPFDILLFISNNYEYRNYWWSTGNPSFLIDLLREKDYAIPQVNHYTASDEILDSFDVDNIQLEALLWQTGYLTITSKKQLPFGMEYQLEVPNREIQTSLNSLFLSTLTGLQAEKIRHQHNLYKALLTGDMGGLKKVIETLFASIPYHNFTNNNIANYEGYYASVLYAYLASLGFTIIPEDITNKGRIDLTLQINDKVYIFEFKMVKAATGNALQQIKARQYAQKYQNSGTIFLVGIEFSKKERNIVGWETEQV